MPHEIQFHDRSIFCTAALSDYLGRARSLFLSQELERAVEKGWFQPEVFFIRSLGFITPTAVQRVMESEEALAGFRVLML